MTHRDTLSPQRIEQALSGRMFGQRIIYHPSIDSTNRAARILALQGGAHGWVVLADEQSAGRGRLDRTWDSQPGADILASIIVYPKLPAADVFQLTMMASIAVVLAVKRVCGLECGIKWPNDIFLQEKKLCGILSEGQIGSDCMQFMVIGIGLNVNSSMTGQTTLLTDAISLQDASGQQQERDMLIIAILEEFNLLYQAGSKDQGEYIKHLWEKHAMMIGREVSIYSGGDILTGVACGIMPDGSLIVREPSGREQAVVCGDLSLRLS